MVPAWAEMLSMVTVSLKEPAVMVYSPSARSSVQRTMEEKSLLGVKESISLPSASVRTTSVPPEMVSGK